MGQIHTERTKVTGSETSWLVAKEKKAQTSKKKKTEAQMVKKKGLIIQVIGPTVQYCVLFQGKHENK